MGSRHTRICLAVLFVIALMLRLGFCAYKTGLGSVLDPGFREYITAGQRLYAHGTLVSPLILTDTDQTPSALLPPGYTALVAATYGALGVESFAAHLALQVVNALATSLCVFVVFRATRLIVPGRAAWVAAGITAVSPVLFGFTYLVWDTNLFALGTAVTVWMAAALAARRTTALGWLGFGLWLGLLALINPALTIAYPFLVLWPVVQVFGWDFRRVARAVALTVIGWAIAIAPWTVRNYVQFGELSYIRGGFMLELWLGVCPEADDGSSVVYASQFPLCNEDVQRHVATVGERAFVEECGRRAREAVDDDPLRFARLSAWRAVDFWFGTLFSIERDGGIPRDRARAALVPILFGELLVIVVSVALIGRIRVEARWLIAAVVAFSLVYCLTHTVVRFRAPIEPIMVVLVAVLGCDALALLRIRWSRRRDRVA